MLTPDIIWHCISNGVAIHVDEKLRNIFVDHDKNKELEVVKMDFSLDKKNPWHELINEFCEKIQQNTKKDGIYFKLIFLLLQKYLVSYPKLL